MKIDPQTLPLVATIAQVAARLLAADPVYRQLVADPDPAKAAIPAARLHLHVNVAIGILELAASKIDARPPAIATPGDLGAIAAAAMSRRGQ